MRNFFKPVVVVAAALAVLAPSPVLACAACYGKSDSPLASGMNWGILALLAVIVTVLASIATFFVFIIRREAALAARAAAENLSEAKA